MNLNGMISAARIAIIKHGPDILTAAGVIGLVASGIMAVSQTPKAVDILSCSRLLEVLSSLSRSCCAVCRFNYICT